MIEALWSVEFVSNLDDYGAGVVVMETGRVLGGDSQYTFIGTYTLGVGGFTEAKIKVSHYAGAPNSIFGTAKEFSLVLAGKPAHAGFEMHGHVEGHPQLLIGIRFTRRAELP